MRSEEAKMEMMTVGRDSHAPRSNLQQLTRWHGECSDGRGRWSMINPIIVCKFDLEVFCLIPRTWSTHIFEGLAHNPL